MSVQAVPRLTIFIGDTAALTTFTNKDGEVVSLFDTKAPPTETEKRIYRATQAEEWNRRKAVALYENFMAGVGGGRAGKDMGELEAADLLKEKIKMLQMLQKKNLGPNAIY